MKAPAVTVIDFETHKIEGRPHYPPLPVGVAIKIGDRPSKYFAWGHPEGNNCTLDDALVELEAAYDSGRPLLFHDAKFDLAVIEEQIGAPPLPWDRVHDTKFLLFLVDPHSKSVGLKSAANAWLGWPPDEQGEVAEWVWENRKALTEQYGGKVNRRQGTVQASNAGEWIAYAPGDLVGRYACGDVDRTYALFQHLYPLIVENGMLEAYDRERKVLPIFMENERLGIRVDVDALARDIPRYHAAREVVDAWIKNRLGAPDLNIDSDAEFAEALSAAGVIDDDKWTLTKTGKRSVSKKNLTPDMYNDAEVASAFGYRNRLNTCLKMFMEPWLAQAQVNGGRISTNWNQTRGGDGGTRTGRPSTSDPNLLNISKSFEGRTDGYQHPSHLDVPELPLVRNYVLPDEDGVFVHRDFDGQELRIFGHFERGALFNAYQENPQLDVHDMVGGEMKRLADKEFERTRVKVINFQSIYGGGIPALVRELNISAKEAKEFKDFHNKALPGRVILNEEITRVVKGGEPIVTWGGRLYFPEEPRRINGRMMDFIYKLLNYLVQGSAADVTKEALIRFYYHPRRKPTWRFLVTVYDEINISVPLEDLLDAMELLREVMESIEMGVKMLSSPKVGVSWGACKKPAKGESELDFLARMMQELAHAP